MVEDGGEFITLSLPETKWFYVSIMMLVVFVASVLTSGFGMIKPGAPTGAVVSQGKASPFLVELFVMSMCPYGVQAENAMYDVYKAFLNEVDFNIHFISSDNGDGTFRSLHGQPETDENIRQLCVMKYAPNKFWDYLECLNPEYGNAETKWEECTTSAGIDTEEVRTCFEEEGAGLLRENIKRTREVGATGSPTIYFGDQKYSGARSPAAFQKAICDQRPGLSGCGANLPGNVNAIGGNC